jgi:hypothetical protein
MEQDGKLFDGLSDEAETSEDIAEQIDRYFGTSGPVAVETRASL